MGAASISSAQELLAVCATASKPCASRDKTFAPYELSFRLPERLGPNVEYRSRFFYAVLLVTFPGFAPGGEECDAGEYSREVERRRRQAQKLYPNAKVFAGHQCPDMGAVLYRVNGKPYDRVFIAVHAGEARAEAEQALATAKARFPRASLQRMQAVYTRLVE